MSFIDHRVALVDRLRLLFQGPALALNAFEQLGNRRAELLGGERIKVEARSHGRSVQVPGLAGRLANGNKMRESTEITALARRRRQDRPCSRGPTDLQSAATGHVTKLDSSGTYTGAGDGRIARGRRHRGSAPSSGYSDGGRTGRHGAASAHRTPERLGRELYLARRIYPCGSVSTSVLKVRKSSD